MTLFQWVSSMIGYPCKVSVMSTSRHVPFWWYTGCSIFVIVCVHSWFIKVMSYECHGVSNHGQLDCSFNSFPGQWQRKHQSCTLQALWEQNPPMTSGFPSQRASNTDCNISVSWRWLWLVSGRPGAVDGAATIWGRKSSVGGSATSTGPRGPYLPIKVSKDLGTSNKTKSSHVGLWFEAYSFGEQSCRDCCTLTLLTYKKWYVSFNSLERPALT